VAYAPCINHGIDMGKSQIEEKRAVESGYWQLYRYNPMLVKEGKNPFIMDSKEPSMEYKEFLEGEERYTSLMKLYPDAANKLFKQAAEDSKERLLNYKRLAER
jgi:pyruvate-ferredoxin/flavodoxin oxidoreductase